MPRVCVTWSGGFLPDQVPSIEWRVNLDFLGGSSVNEMLLRVTWGRWVVFAGGQSNI